MTVVPYKSQESTKKDQVASMFDNISGTYDFLNHFLSLGIDNIWRRNAVKKLRDISPKQILDIATGTGDFAIAALKLNPEKVTGIDISTGMLDMGREKMRKKGLDKRIELLEGDSESIQFEDNKFDAIIVAFGVRNFENLEKGLGEMLRVLKPGGKAVILEFSQPSTFPFKQGYNFYFRSILPKIGKLVSKDSSAYTYLPESVNAFPDGQDFLDILKKTGYKDVEWDPQTFGVSSIYTGTK